MAQSTMQERQSLRLGVSAFVAGHWLTAEEVLLLEAAPVASLELGAPWFWEVSAEEVATTLEALRRSALERWSVHAPFGRGLDLSALDDDVQRQTLDAVEQAFAFARLVGSQLVVVHPSAEPIPPAERHARLARARAGLAAVAEFASAAGPRVAIEPLPRTCLGNRIEEIALLLERLPVDRVGICLDVNHANVGQDLAAFVQRFGSRIWTLHISDNDGVDEKHWLPGEGVIDWPALIHALQGVGYQGPFLYEVGRGDKALAERLREFRDNYRALMGGGA